jgi:MSHA biogenesis protein MshJ
MQDKWMRISDKFSALSEREKWLIALCGTIAVVLILFTMLVEPTIQNYDKTVRAISSEQNDIVRLENENIAYEAKLTRNPDIAVDKELELVKIKSEELSIELDKVVNSLISPSQMPVLLDSVLSKSSKLKLVGLSSLPAEAIVKDMDGAGYYLHPVRIEITGRYFDVLAYLKELESMPVRYYWRSFNYKVEEYPQARLVMEVYTLGSAQEFIGG